MSSAVLQDWVPIFSVTASSTLSVAFWKRCIPEECHYYWGLYTRNKNLKYRLLSAVA